jgi:MFS family permease
VIGGAVAQGIDWPWIFWINVPVGLIGVPLILARIPESRGEDRTLDLRGLVLLTGAALGIVWGLVRSNDAGWGSVEVVSALAAGVLLLAGFVAAQAASRAPMIPPALFRSRAFSAANGAMFLTVASLFGAVFFLAQFLQTGLGYDALGAGLRLLPWTATLFFVAPIAGTLVDRFGERPFLVAGLTLQGVGMGWIALIAQPGMAYASMIPALMIAGAGVSMALPSAQNAAIGAVPARAIGKAAGINSTVRELGGVFGIAIAVAVFATAQTAGVAPAQAFADGFTAALTAVAALSFLGALVAVAVPARSRVTVLPDADVAVAES